MITDGRHCDPSRDAADNELSSPRPLISLRCAAAASSRLFPRFAVCARGYGRLDCAFNNAGIAGGGPIETLDEEIWDRIIDTNLKTAFFCLKAEAMQMKAQG